MTLFNGRTFKPGDQVEVIANSCAPSTLIGKRGTVVEIPDRLIGMLIFFALTSSYLHEPFAVDIDGKVDLICRNALRKINDRGDWKQIERETGYTPPVAVPA